MAPNPSAIWEPDMRRRQTRAEPPCPPDRRVDDASSMATEGEPTGIRHPVELALVRSVHTAVFLGELGAIGWLVVSGWIGRRDRSVAWAAAAVAAEAGVFVANAGVCPLTPLSERLGAADGSVSDIFLPDPIARTIPIWSSALLALAALLHLRGALRQRSVRAARGGSRGVAALG